MNQEEHNNKSKMIKDAVRRLMTEDFNCRNSDNYLILRFWANELGRSEVRVEDAHRITIAKDIYNARTEIQNKECILLPTLPGVLIKRKFKQELVRNYYASNPDLVSEFERMRFDIR